MNRAGILSPFWEQASKDPNLIDFYPTPSDSTHFIVRRFLGEGKETIGHVYVEFEGDDFRYISTNLQDKQIFPPTSDFNTVEKNFEKYARFLGLQKTREKNIQSKNSNQNINLKKSKTMKTQSKNTDQKILKENQMVFIEYTKPTKDGHFLTVGDKYKNTIARIYERLNEETKKYEYEAFDHEGKFVSKSDKLWELKNEFAKNQEVLLQQAHQRRIEAKEHSKEIAADKPKEQIKVEERKAELEKMHEGKTGKETQVDKAVDNDINQKEERMQELGDLRNNRYDDKEDISLER